MTNFFNKFKKPKNSFWLMHTFIWVSSTCKNLEKTNDAITRKRPENWATKERTGLVLQDPFGYHWGSIESGIGSLMWIYHCLTPNVHSKPFQGEIWEVFSCTKTPPWTHNINWMNIWYHLYNLKNVKNTHGGVLLLVKLQAFN